MRRAVTLVALGSLLAACGAGPARPTDATRPDGVYRRTTSGATWTIAMSGRRFAVTRSDRRGCTWAYGGLSAHGRRLELRVVDAAGPAAASTAEPSDMLRLVWSRYRDLIELRPLSGGTATLLAGAPWRQVTEPAGASQHGQDCRAPAAALTPTGVEDVRPTGAILSFSGDFVRTGPTRWEGRGTAKELGPGRMTIEGDVVLGPLTRTRITFVLRVARGTMRGCSITTILRRPNRRYVWDGPGQITSTSPRLRKYLALSGGIGGVTYTYARDRMHGGFGSYPGPRPRGRLRADVVC